MEISVQMFHNNLILIEKPRYSVIWCTQYSSVFNPLEKLDYNSQLQLIVKVGIPTI